MANTQEQMLDLLEREELPYADDASASIKRVRRMPKNKRFIPEESLNLLESYKPKIREERQAKTRDENVEKMKSVGTGLLTGFAGLPSDIIEGVNFVNDFLAEQGSPKALLFKDAINEMRENYGRKAFDKKFTEITGIKSDGTNVSQIMGEVLSPTGAFVATAKGAVKVTEGASKLYKFLKDNFELQNKLLKGDVPPGTGGAVQVADGPTLTASNVSGQMGDIIEKNKDIIKVGVDTAKGTKTVNTETSNNAPTINEMSMAGLRSTTGRERIAKFRELEKTGNLNKDQLFEKTGVYRGEDGKPRMEIDTSSASIDLDVLRNLNKDKTRSLYDFLKFDKLYQEYPDRLQSGLKNFQPIRNVKINLKRVADVDPITGEKKTSLGSYNAEKDSITVNLDNIEAKVIELLEETPTLSYEELYKAQLESSILHEIQHAIQYREGFLKGANSKQFLPNDFQLRKEKFNKEVKGLTKKASKDQSIIKKLQSEAEALDKIQDNAYNAYRNTYGEREATLVQKRFIERLRLKGKKFSEKDVEIIMRATKIPKSMQGTLPKLNTTTTSSTPTKINEEELSPLVAKKLKEIDYMGPDAFHATTKDFKTFGFVSKNNEADIGFHVGSKPNQASARVERNPNQLGARTLPLKLKRELKPARIPDLSSFKEPSNWLRNIAVSNKDPLFRVMNDTPEGRAAIKKQIEDNIPIKIGDQTYYIQPDLMKGSLEDIGFKDKGIDKNLWKDLVLESTRAIRTGLDTTKNFKDRQEWFDTIKKVANKNGYDSYIYRNEYEGQVFDTLTGKTKRDDSYMLLETDQAKGKFGGMTKGEPDFMKNQGGLLLSEGGNIMKQQMELFEEGGLKDEGNTIDPISGNEVPPGSNQEEVRDDIPAQLSEGEFVFPADVVRYIGLEKLMVMRQEAKAGLARMEEMGQMGNSDEATLPDDMPFKTSSEEDDMPFTMEDLDTEEETEYNRGGVVYAQSGTFIANNPNVTTQQSMFQNQNLPSSNITQPVNYNVPNIPAPVGGFTPKFSGQVGQTGQQGATPTFQTLVGRNPGQYDEMREYRNEAGMKLNIPFKNGEPIYPIPEGYTYIDPEATKTEEVTTKEVKPQTARVVEEQGGDDGDNKPGGAVDLAGDPLKYMSVFGMDKLDTELKNIAFMQGGNIFNVKQQVLERGIFKQADIVTATLINQKNEYLNTKNGLLNAQGEREGGLKDKYGPNFNVGDMASLLKEKNPSYSDEYIKNEVEKDRNMLANVLESTKKTINLALRDDEGKVISMDKFKDQLKKYELGDFKFTGITKQDRGNFANKANQLGMAKQKEKEGLAEGMRKAGEDRPNIIQDANIASAIQREDEQQQYGTVGGTSIGVGKDPYDSSSEPSYDQEYDSRQDTSFEGAYEDDDMYMKRGGLAGKKKKKPKVKNMKRGGLASR